METHTEIGMFEDITGESNSIWFSPDGRTLVSRDDDNTLRLWDVDTQTKIHTLDGYTGSLESLSFSPDGRILASGGQDNMVRLWDVDTRIEAGTLEGHTGYVSSVSFSPDGKMIATGSGFGTILLWDADTQTEIGKLEGHTRSVNGVSFSPDGRKLVSGSSDGTVRLWDVDTRTEISILREIISQIWGVSFSPDGRTVTYLGGAGNLLDVNKKTVVQGYTSFQRKHTWEVLWIIEALVDAYYNNIQTIYYLHSWDISSRNSVQSVSFSPDGKTIAASGGNSNGFTRMWDVGTLTEINRIEIGGFSFSRLGIKNVSFSPDGKTIVSRCEQNVICLRDAVTYAEIRRLEIPRRSDIAVFSPDGYTLAVLRHEHSPLYGSPVVRLWDVDTVTEIGILWEHIGQVQSVSFSPDGRTLASAGSIDGTVRLWDVDTLTQAAVLRGHTGWENNCKWE